MTPPPATGPAAAARLTIVMLALALLFAAAAGSLSAAAPKSDAKTDTKADVKADPKTETKADAKTPVTKTPAEPVDDVLDRFAAAGKDINALAAEIEEVYKDELVGDEQRRSGIVYLTRGEKGARVRIDLLADRTKKVEERFIFDGKVFWKINFKAKTIQGFEQSGTAAAEVFDIGRGPFPLPIGQPREKVVRLFEAKLVTKPGEDPVTVRLRPRPGTDYQKEYDAFEFSAKVADGVPTQVVTRNKAGIQKTITLKARTGAAAAIPADAFAAPNTDSEEFRRFSFDLRKVGS